MANVMRKCFLGFALISWTVTFSGCIPLLIGAAAGAGGIAYVKGALVQNIDEGVEKLHDATLAALKDLEIFATSDEVNRHSSVIKAEYADGRKVEIKIGALTEYVSKITIRVGLVGDQEDSRLILNAIEKKL